MKPRLPHPIRLVVALLLLAVAAAAAPEARAAVVPMPPFFLDVRAFGALPNDAVDDLAAIDRAGAAAAAVGGGGVVGIPAGTYVVAPSGSATYIRLRSNVTFTGAGRQTVLKVKDNAGNYQALFWDAGTTVTNVAIRDLTIDQNPTGNTTADVRTYDGITVLNNNQCQFVVYVQGSNSSGIEISGVRFDKCDGVNTVSINAAGAGGVKFNDNVLVFERGHTAGTMPGGGPFNGTTGYDASVGYFACKGVQGYGNTVVVGNYAHYNGGIEIHGVEQDWQHNTFEGCYTAFSIVPPFAAADNQNPSNVVVANNTVHRAAVAVAMQLPGLSPNQVNAWGWKVHNNNITLYQAGGHHDSTESAGVRLGDNGLTASVLDGLEVTDNRIEFEPDTRASSTRYGRALLTTQHGIILSQRSALRNATVRGNKVVRAPTTGIQLGYVDALAELTNVNAWDNETVDCGANPNNAAANTNNQRAHWDVTGLCTNVRVHDNQLTDTGPGSSLVGLYGLRLGPMASPLFSYAANNRQKTSILPLLLYVHDFGYNLLGVNHGAITNGASLSHLSSPDIRVQPAANVTGVLLTAGVYHEQRVTVFNESDFTITFAATGTFGQAGASNVAAGTSEVIGPQQCRTFVWNAVVNKWYAAR